MIKLTNLLEEIDEGLFDDLKNKIMGRPVVKKSGSIWSHSGEEGSFGAKFGDRIEYFDTKEKLVMVILQVEMNKREKENYILELKKI